MASTLAPTIAPDDIVSFEINPGTLLQFLENRAEGGPHLKCFEGSVTLVSPGLPHEMDGHRPSLLIYAVCFVLGMRLNNSKSTTWYLPLGADDAAYEADAAFYIQSQGRAKPSQPPDLAVEVLVSNPATKALRAGVFLKIPELWVLDNPEHRISFYHLIMRGKQKGAYRPATRSRAFPVLAPADVLRRLDDPETDDLAFQENCRVWAREVLVPRQRAENGGG
jgi:Uma2 family endonuclease